MRPAGFWSWLDEPITDAYASIDECVLAGLAKLG